MTKLTLEESLTKSTENFYISKTTYLTCIPEKALRDKLVKLYNSSSETHRCIASILNALYTEGKTTFYLSKKSLLKLTKADKNITGQNRPPLKLGGKNINLLRQAVMNLLSQLEEFQVLRESSLELKTPACISLTDMSLFAMMDEKGRMTAKLMVNWAQAAIDALDILSSTPTQKQVVKPTTKKRDITSYSYEDLQNMTDEEVEELSKELV